jgi:hypothetical protein
VGDGGTKEKQKNLGQKIWQQSEARKKGITHRRKDAKED